jgi:hypothetical protein
MRTTKSKKTPAWAFCRRYQNSNLSKQMPSTVSPYRHYVSTGQCQRCHPWPTFIRMVAGDAGAAPPPISAPDARASFCPRCRSGSRPGAPGARPDACPARPAHPAHPARRTRRPCMGSGSMGGAGTHPPLGPALFVLPGKALERGANHRDLKAPPPREGQEAREREQCVPERAKRPESESSVCQRGPRGPKSESSVCQRGPRGLESENSLCQRGPRGQRARAVCAEMKRQIKANQSKSKQTHLHQYRVNVFRPHHARHKHGEPDLHDEHCAHKAGRGVWGRSQM